MTRSETIRERTRRVVRAEVCAVAIPLFEDQGFRSTTIEQIADAAGMSVRTFFRYFDAKEDLLVGDPAEQTEAVAAAFADRPPEEPVWTALRRALGTIAQQSNDAYALRTSALILRHPELRARHLEKQTRWTDVLTPLVAERLSGPTARRTLSARSVVSAALACFDTAVAEWTQAAGSTDLNVLLDRTMRSVGQIAALASTRR